MRSLILASAALLLVLAKPAAAEEVTLQHDGLTLVGNLETAGDMPAEDVVLIVHGTLVHHGMDTIAGLQEMFADYGADTLAITLSLGEDKRRGARGCEGTHDHMHTNAMAEIAAWADWLQGQGVDRIALMGHSRGGNQVVRAALDHELPAVDALVLLAPMTAGDAPSEAELEVVERARGMAPGAVLQSVPFLYCKAADVTAATYLDYIAPDPLDDTPALLAKLDRPAIVFAGSEDEVVPGVEQRVQGMTGDDLRLHVVYGSDHFFRDLFADEVADETLAFLSEVRGE